MRNIYERLAAYIILCTVVSDRTPCVYLTFIAMLMRKRGKLLLITLEPRV